jgi:hypothetical protein
MAVTSGLVPTIVIRVARVTSNGVPPASVSEAGAGIIRGASVPD